MMRDQVIRTDPIAIKDQRSPRSANHTAIQPRWQPLATAAWLVVTGLNVLMFALAVPTEYGSHTATAARLYAGALAEMGISFNFYAAYRVFLDVLLAGAFTITGGLIFLRKRDDWLAMLVSLAAITFGSLFVPTLITLTEAQPAWLYPVGLLRAIGLASSLVVFFYLLPDGRLVPSWTRPMAAAWLGLSAIWLLFPDAPFNLVHLHTWVETLGLSVAVMLVFFGSGVVAQVVRFTRHSDHTARLQTKWVVFGTSLAVLGFLLYHLPLIFVPELQSNGVARVLYIFLAIPLYHLFVLAAPVCIGIACARFRLLEIDLLINRTLVYGVLSALLAALYFGSVVLVQQIFKSSLEQMPSLAVVISTLVIAAPFTPLRRAVQRMIDRRFYRRKYDSAKVLEDFSATVRSEVDLNRLTQRLVSVVDDTIEPAQVSVWLRPMPKVESLLSMDDRL